MKDEFSILIDSHAVNMSSSDDRWRLPDNLKCSFNIVFQDHVDNVVPLCFTLICGCIKLYICVYIYISCKYFGNSLNNTDNYNSSNNNTNTNSNNYNNNKNTQYHEIVPENKRYHMSDISHSICLRFMPNPHPHALKKQQRNLVIYWLTSCHVVLTLSGYTLWLISIGCHVCSPSNHLY